MVAPVDGTWSGLAETVRRNCLIADARHARDMTMCTYLLAMREHYRREAGIALDADIPRAALGEWLEAREQLWDSVEHEDYAPLQVGAARCEPFDAECANDALNQAGLFYSGGIGIGGRAHFCFARLAVRGERDGVDVLEADEEYASDMLGVPAALQRGTIYLRREAIRRWLWTRVEEWRWRKRNAALGRAFAIYGVEQDLASGLARMVESERESILLHELGEVRAGESLGDAWTAMTGGLDSHKAELLARSVRDLLADCLVTLPALLGNAAHPAPIHFFVGNLTGMRRELFPGLLDAYERWVEDGDLQPMHGAVSEGARHWQAQAMRLLERCAAEGARAGPALEALADDRSLRL